MSSLSNLINFVDSLIISPFSFIKYILKFSLDSFASTNKYYLSIGFNLWGNSVSTKKLLISGKSLSYKDQTTILPYLVNVSNLFS